MKEKIDWNKVAKDNRSCIRIAKSLNINSATVYRNLKKRGLKKVANKNSLETIKRKKASAKRGKDNHNWKGDNVSYKSLHIWVKRHKPKSKLCEDCNEQTPYDLANISGEYKRDVDDYKWVCRSCHMKEDGRMNNLLKGNPNSKRDQNGRFIKCDGNEEQWKKEEKNEIKANH